jgi:hypothetical protein
MTDIAKVLGRVNVKLNVVNGTITDVDGSIYSLSTLEKASYQWREGKPTLLGAKTQRVRLTLEIQLERMTYFEVKFTGRHAASEASDICDELNRLAKTFGVQQNQPHETTVAA